MDPAPRIAVVSAWRSLAPAILLLLSASLLGGCAKLDGLRRLDPFRALAPHGAVSGQVHVGRAGNRSALGPAVVFLTSPEKGAPGSPTVRTIRVRDGRPAASFAVLGPGDAVRFASADSIHHRFFARSERGEAIEIAIPPKRTSRPFRPRASERGLRFYCQLHEADSILLFVSPSPHYAVVDARGRYTIADVASGTWRLHVWSEAIAGSIREIVVDGRGADEAIWLDAQRLGRR